MIRKAVTFLLTVCFAGISFSQANIEGLVKAERSFAAHSLAKGTKSSFLAYADTNSIMFDKGKPVNGHALWAARQEDKSVLSWGPDYVEMSLSNDFGYTAGPWTYHTSSLKDTPVAQGHFATVWHRNAQGEWKFLVDLGISYAGKWTGPALIKIPTANKTVIIEQGDHPGQVEEAFIHAYREKGAAAYTDFLSTKSRLLHNGHMPVTDRAGQKKLLDILPADLIYTRAGGGMSPGNDLLYAYGSISYKDKTESYLRIWRLEKEGWKIALEVLR